MKKAISTISIPSLNIHVGDCVACARGSMGLDTILMAHSGMTFYNHVQYVDAEVTPEVCDAMDEAFDAGLELGYARSNFGAFMRIFSATTIGDVNRAMATCRDAL